MSGTEQLVKPEIETILPLSPMQQGMLFHWLYEKGPHYFQQWHLSLQGQLNAAALREAWRTMVERHGALRTSFAWKRSGEPLQVVRGDVTPMWEEHDWSELDRSQQQQKIDKYLLSDRQRGFDLSRAPLARLTLIRLGAESRLIWSNHHIILDAWSRLKVFEELFRAYQSNQKREPVQFEFTPPYSDYISWLRKQSRTEAESFWRRALDGFVSPTRILDSGGAEVPEEEQFAVARTRFDADSTARLRAFSRAERLTLNTLVQGAWGLLLSRYADENDVVFGATVSGRPPALAGVGSMVGLFINTLPVRVRVDPAMPVGRWLSGIQDGQVESREFEWSALTDIQGWSGVPRGTPLFESLLVFENLAGDWRSASPGDLTIREVGFFERTNYPLTVTAEAIADELSFQITYDRRRFDDASIGRLLGHLRTILREIPVDSRRAVELVPWLTDAERRQVIEQWNQTEKEYPRTATVPGLFQEQAERTPEATAVVFGEERLTYRQLNDRANRLARYLAKRGVGPEVLVGLCVERSMEMIVGLLGILKAGGAYVPLDPAYPRERVQFMLEDSGARIVLTQESLWERLPERLAEGVRLDADWNEIEKESSENPARRCTSENLAYVIYTSGSTGKPKGVAIEHHSTVALLAWARELFAGGELDGVLASTSICFDLSIFEIFAPLAWGGKVILSRDALQLPELPAAGEVRLVNTVPSAMSELLRIGALPGSVTTVNLAGEPLGPSLVREILGGGVVQRVFDLYGPTEDTTYSTCAQRLADGPATIGRPISNKRAYILDSRLQPVPVAVVGDLYVAGAGVARGYLNRPELTAEKFLPDPFHGEGARMYRTGDRARFSPTGDLQFLGRMDNQVKIRGYRIEIGEIEEALVRHPNVRACAVAAWQDESGNKRLVGYLVTRNGDPLSVTELRDFLKVTLPDYMVPSVFLFLGSLPLTPNGKLDRKALPPPGEERPELGDAYVAPRNDDEKLLAGIWAGVLRVGRVGIRDNFFDLGGDSILSIQVIARAERAGLRITPKQLFQHPTVEELAALGERRQGDAGRRQLLVEGAVDLTPIQLWFLDAEMPERHHFNQSMLLGVPAEIDASALERAFAQIVTHHDALRLRLFRQDGAWHQTNAPLESAAIFSTIDLANLEPREHAAFIESAAARAQRSLDLGRGPILRAVLFQRGKNHSGRLLIVIHHVAVDGVSWRILLEDLETAYRSCGEGSPLALPPKTSSFQSWATGLRVYGQSEALRAELDYWLSVPRGGAETIPVDFSRGANTEEFARRVHVQLDTGETQALLRDVPRAYRTQINDALLGALSQAFREWAGAEALYVDVEGHGREDVVAGADLSRTVGWFTSIFPIRLNTSVESPGEAIKYVKERLREIPNHGIGYGVLRYLSSDDVRRRLAALPRPQVSFNYLGQFDQVVSDSAFFRPASESCGPEVGPKNPRRHLLDVSGRISGDVLRLTFTYGQHLHRRNTIESLAAAFLAAIRDLIAHCGTATRVEFTPSDFPLAGLDQKGLDRVFKKFGDR